MSETLFKKLFIYFGLIMLVCLIPLIISIIYKIVSLSIISSLLMGLAFLSEITFISVFYSDNRNFRKVIYFSIPVCLILAVVFAFISDILTIILGLTALLATSVAVYIFNQRRTTLFLYIFISLTFVGIFLRRFHLPGAGVVLTVSSVLFSVGIFMYGLKFLFYTQKNKYLSVLIPVCSTILMIFSMGAVFKLQHWAGAGILMKTSTATIILVTIITLLTLPQSGYFNWAPEQRKSFYRNIVVPWIVAASFIAYYFLMPQSTKEIIFPPRYQTAAHFYMFPYDLEQPDTADTNEK